jgi:hypothetical protein
VPAGKKPDLYRRTMLLLTSAIVILILFDTFHERNQAPHPLSVAIIDPLSPDAGGEFTSLCAQRFQSVGYVVDIVKGSGVSVDFLKSLKHDYTVIIFRVHSGVFEDSVWFFTGEKYDSGKHVLEQLANEVHIARTSRESELLFAVGSRFVRRFMGGRFEDSLVVLMGCDGLTSSELAEAFLEAGAAAYVSWDGPVSLSHTDEVTLALIEGIVEGMTLEGALKRSLELVGLEERYGSSLGIYPLEGAAFTLNEAARDV